MKLTFDKLVSTKPEVEVKADKYTSTYYDKDSATSDGAELDEMVFTKLDNIQIGDSKTKPTFTAEQQESFDHSVTTLEYTGIGSEQCIYSSTSDEYLNDDDAEYYYKVGNAYGRINSYYDRSLLSPLKEYIKYAINGTPVYKITDKTTYPYTFQPVSPKIIIKTGVTKKPEYLDYEISSIGSSVYRINVDKEFDGYYAGSFNYTGTTYIPLNEDTNSVSYITNDESENGTGIKYLPVYKKTGDSTYELVDGLFLKKAEQILAEFVSQASGWLDINMADDTYNSGSYYALADGEYIVLGYSSGNLNDKRLDGTAYNNILQYIEAVINGSKIYTKNSDGTYTAVNDVKVVTNTTVTSITKVPYTYTSYESSLYGINVDSEYSDKYIKSVNSTVYYPLNGDSCLYKTEPLNGYALYEKSSDGSGNEVYTIMDGVFLFNS